jgi:translocation and assembly module TamA
MRTPIRFLPAIACLLVIAPAHALRLADVQVHGIDDPGQLDNALQSISLQRLDARLRGDLSEDRLSYLLRKATGEIRTALEPYGYYDTEVTSAVQRNGDAVTVVFDVVPGAPVRVRDAQLAMDGEGRDDPLVAMALRDFRPVAGAVLDHRVYEASKATVNARLSQHGYFDATLPVHTVAVTRATHGADIRMRWNSGVRYRVGETRFGKNQFRPGLFDPLVPWKVGDAYDQQQLLELQQSLAALDYFGVIDVVPKLDEAKDGKVPVAISTTPGKRNVYRAGVSYGTDSGAGVQLGFDRRWVNAHGDKLVAQVEYAQRRKIAAAQYRIPAFAWLNGFYTLGASLRDEQTDAIDHQLLDVVAGRSGRLHGWNLDAGLHYQRERYQDFLDPDFNRYATLVFPALAAQFSNGDDKLYPTRGWGLNADLRAGSTAIGSDVDFAQFRVQGRFVFSLGQWNRVLLRGELGRTFTRNFDRLPPSLRFFAGGDSSVRGYGYQEIGPKLLGRVVGGPSLAVFSAEFEHRFTAQWGAAAFVDAGDAFDTRPHMHVGVGLGLRWRSPVGPVRIDLAHGLNAPQQGIRLHLNIGTDL